jgi:outer membrane biosynthesis protein TonB
MTLRIVAATTACIGFLIVATFAAADGMPEPEDDNFNPVPSVPGTPAPGVTQPAPIKPAKPAPVVAPKPAPAPVVSAPEPTPPPDEPDDVEPSTPAPAPTPAPVSPPPVTTPPAATTPSVQKKQIYEILSVDVQVTPKPAAMITVKATARTGGWKDIELKPLQTFAAEVGMRSYTLVGTPPSGPSTQALSPVSVTITLDPLPADVKTIRVLGETNEVAQTFR